MPADYLLLRRSLTEKGVVASNGDRKRYWQMKLTDNEIRDINSLLEAGKPLPDKYRFLLFEDKREVELVWNGKTNEVCNIALPFQTIEQVDEPRAERPSDATLQGSLFDLDARGRQLKGWTNKLIWGDNKLILSSLKNGPLREEIERQGGLKLIYIDPPFDVGADFSMDIEIGDETFIKKPNILEEIAYRDTWGKGTDSFIAMIYERLVLMRDLLAEDGSIYVHCDWRVQAFVRLVLDEIFSRELFVNEIMWCYTQGGRPKEGFPNKHDNIFLFRKSEKFVLNKDEIRIPFDLYSEKSSSSFTKIDNDGRRYKEVYGPGKKKLYKYYEDEGKIPYDWWSDIPKITGRAAASKDTELVGYPTQKPEVIFPG